MTWRGFRVIGVFRSGFRDTAFYAGGVKQLLMVDFGCGG
jgi:hypothetical protein